MNVLDKAFAFIRELRVTRVTVGTFRATGFSDFVLAFKIKA